MKLGNKYLIRMFLPLKLVCSLQKMLSEILLLDAYNYIKLFPKLDFA